MRVATIRITVITAMQLSRIAIQRRTMAPVRDTIGVAILTAVGVART